MIVYNGRHIGSPIKEFTATSKPGKELKKFTITAKEYEGRVANSADMRIMVRYRLFMILVNRFYMREGYQLCRHAYHGEI